MGLMNKIEGIKKRYLVMIVISTKNRMVLVAKLFTIFIYKDLLRVLRY